MPILSCFVIVDITETESQIYLLILISEKRQDEEREDPTIDELRGDQSWEIKLLGC